MNNTAIKQSILKKTIEELDHPNCYIYHKVMRGTVLWLLYGLYNGSFFLRCIDLINKNKTWEPYIYNENNLPIIEDNTNERFFLCPIKYMNAANITEAREPLNKQWRQIVINKLNEKKLIQNGIKQTFKQLDDNQVVKIFLKPESSLSHNRGIDSLILEEILPMCGRIKGKGKLYEIPISLISGYEVIPWTEPWKNYGK